MNPPPLMETDDVKPTWRSQKIFKQFFMMYNFVAPKEITVYIMKDISAVLL